MNKALLLAALLSIPSYAQQSNPGSFYPGTGGGGSDAKTIQGNPVSNTAPQDGQTLIWNAANHAYQPGAPQATSLPWGSLLGDISSQTDLKNALDSKLADPGSNGIVKRTASGTTGIAVGSDLPAGYPFNSLANTPALVNSFNGRSGAITPQASDYSSFYQATGNYLLKNGISGDGTTDATGKLTLSTVDPGAAQCGDATHICQILMNTKGLITSQNPILIDTSRVNGQLVPLGASLVGTDSSGHIIANNTSYLTTNQNITISGDGSGSGSTAINFVLNNVNSGSGACGDATHICSVTTNPKGLVVSQQQVAITANGMAAPANGTNCVVQYTTGTTTTCVPTGTAGFIHQDGAGNVSVTAGTGADPTTINYTPSSSNSPATVTQQVHNDNSTYVTEWLNGAGAKPVCGDTGTDNSQSLVHAMAHANLVIVPPNCNLTIDNITVPSNVTIQCMGNHNNNTGFTKLAGTTSTPMFSFPTGTFFAGIRGCVINGNHVNTTSSLVSINQASSITISDNVFRNPGTAGTTLVRDIQAFQSSVNIEHNTAGDSPTGTFAFVDFGGSTTRSVRILNNTLPSIMDNAITVENSGASAASSVPDLCTVAGNHIYNVTSAGGTGQSGNGILLYQIQGCDVYGNIVKTTQFSPIRVGQNSAFNDVHDNKMYDGLDAFYCSEEGGFGNKCHDNHIYGGHGIIAANQGSRALNLPDEIYNNTIFGGDSFGIHDEGAIVHDNYVYNTPIGYQIGAGSTTGGTRFYHNHCFATAVTGNGSQPASGLNIGQPMSTCMVVDPGTNASLTEVFDANDLGSGWQLPVGIVGVNNSVGISAITQANPAVITINGTDSHIKVGAKVCLMGMDRTSMVQADGYCPTVTAISGSNVTVALDTTTFSPFVATTGYQSLWVYWDENGNPVQQLGGTDLVTNMEIPLSMLGGMKVGSQVRVPNSECSGGVVVAGSSTIWATKINSSTFACMIDSTGQMQTANGLKGGGIQSGSVVLKDATSGHSVTIQPQSGLSSDQTQTVPIP